MKILKVIHGYPPRYNAGSEVYSQSLCHALAKEQHVEVFTRAENPFVADYTMRLEYDNKIPVHLINIPGEKHRYRYSHKEVDQQFATLLAKLKPDVVHIGHLNHLSTTVITEIKKLNTPIVYTLHDYWLMCPRGQLIQRNPQENNELWARCDGQEDRKCAQFCYAGYFSGIVGEHERDVQYWTDWVARRMSHIRALLQQVDLFIAPSKCLYEQYTQQFGLPENKIMYLDYGFDLSRLKNRKRIQGEPITFGYIGTHIPAKGIQHLIPAFAKVTGNCQLRIWGRPRGQNTEALLDIVKGSSESVQQRITWRSEYRNEAIVQDVFNHVDCIVVPSIWLENSPLVIHEALQARVPVITADAGGMAEYVGHEANGLLFKHRDINSLAAQMQHLVDEPGLLTKLGQRGYLSSSDGNILDMQSQAETFCDIYQELLSKKGRKNKEMA